MLMAWSLRKLMLSTLSVRVIRILADEAHAGLSCAIHIAIKCHTMRPSVSLSNRDSECSLVALGKIAYGPAQRKGQQTMAGDWIKWTKGLEQKREVRAIANALGFHRLYIAGACMAVWSWADSETEDGRIRGITLNDIDDVSGVKGFGAEMEKNGWIRMTTRGVLFINFGRHNMQTAKTRALTNERVQRKRNADSVTKALPEKRREKKSKKKINTSASTRGGSTAEEKSIEVSWTKSSGWRGFDEADRARWAEAYPACNVDRQLLAMDDWLRSNPLRAHKSNWSRFITNWFKREQDRGGDAQFNRTRSTNDNSSRLRTPPGKYEGVGCKLQSCGTFSIAN